MANQPQQVAEALPRGNEAIEPLPIEDRELPASFRIDAKTLAPPSSALQLFLDSDLSVERIDRVLSSLWIVGRPYLPRSLSTQLVLNRNLVATNDASLHLVWTSTRILLKPLPRYMLSDTFYEQYLRLPNPHRPALGLLYSYLALMPTELDFAIAKSTYLIPGSYEWESWRILTQRVLREYPDKVIYDHTARRYVYGELRLSRLNKIYRFSEGNWLRGYSNLTATTSYAEFFAANLSKIAVTTVYTVVILTAMQVILAADALKDNTLFHRTCYGFAVFAIISPIFGIGLIVTVFVIVFFVNFWRSVAVQHSQSK